MFLNSSLGRAPPTPSPPPPTTTPSLAPLLFCLRFAILGDPKTLLWLYARRQCLEILNTSYSPRWKPAVSVSLLVLAVCLLQQFSYVDFAAYPGQQIHTIESLKMEMVNTVTRQSGLA